MSMDWITLASYGRCCKIGRIGIEKLEKEVEAKQNEMDALKTKFEIESEKKDEQLKSNKEKIPELEKELS